MASMAAAGAIFAAGQISMAEAPGSTRQRQSGKERARRLRIATSFFGLKPEIAASLMSRTDYRAASSKSSGADIAYAISHVG
jgi:hypothetical protein